jgi:serine/threonine protein kinase
LTAVDDSSVKNLIGYSEISNQFYLIIDKVSEEDCLTNCFKSYSFQRKLETVKEVAEIIRRYHCEKNLSLDIVATNNIYVINNTIKLSVHSLRRVIKECHVTDNRAGKSPYYNYLCPDVFDMNAKDELNVQKEGNIWSFGCVLSEIFSHFLPWSNKYKQNDVILMKLLIRKSEFPIPEKLIKINHRIEEIVRECVQIIAEKRSKIENVSEKISHILSEKHKIYSMVIMFNSKIKFRGLTKKNVLVELYRYL